MLKDKSGPPETRRYDANYGKFQSELYSAIRREAYGEDIGQNSWLTADEHDKFLSWLGLSADQTLLDVACGAGGPALRAAEKASCDIVGVDVHESGIAAANSAASTSGLSRRAKFLLCDAAQRLPFPDAAFDAIICIDAINHLPARSAVFAEWFRLLKPRGKALFTDPITVTGLLTNEEIRVRSMSGFYLFAPLGFNDLLLAESGFELLQREDATKNMSAIAERRRVARGNREKELREVEGDSGFEEQQDFLTVAHRIASELRLSRFAYLAEKRG